MTTIDLTGQKILVTGASRGIGRAIALELADCGAHVAAHYNQGRQQAEELAKTAGSKMQLFQAELSSSDDTLALFEQVLTTMGGLDALVNNAGVAFRSEMDAPTDKWLSNWRQTMAINLEAVGILSRQAVNYFKEQGGGRLINISSRAAFRGDTEDYLAYAASKGGVVALTRSIARAFGKQNIKAFNIAPGFVQTGMADEFIKEYGPSIVYDDIALNKITQPEDVAHMVAFLASGLGDHATGGTFDINAGSYVH
jgi:NAD(P)-dependent dehydrogenase (short-subunit alcohol dehydrogenase family)